MTENTVPTPLTAVELFVLKSIILEENIRWTSSDWTTIANPLLDRAEALGLVFRPMPEMRAFDFTNDGWKACGVEPKIVEVWHKRGKTHIKAGQVVVYGVYSEDIALKAFGAANTLTNVRTTTTEDRLFFDGKFYEVDDFSVHLVDEDED